MRVAQPTITRTQADGSKIKTKSKTWHLYFRTHTGESARIVGSQSKEASDALAGQVRRLVAYAASRTPLGPDLIQWASDIPKALRGKLVALGLLPDTYLLMDEMISDLIVRWGMHIESQSKGQTSHAASSMAQVAKVLDACGFVRYDDIKVEKVQEWIELLDRTGRTKNAYISACKRFAKWVGERTNMPANLLLKLQAINVGLDTNLPRRAFTKHELHKLTTSPRIPASRQLLYDFAACTGLRAGEIRQLTTSHFKWKDDRGWIALPGEITKSRKRQEVPLPDYMAHVIGGRVIKLGKDVPLLKVPARPAEEVREDCRKVGIQPFDGGQKLDFHSFRKTYISRLVEAGVHPKVVQELARHADIRTTMNIYAEVNDTQKVHAISALNFDPTQ